MADTLGYPIRDQLTERRAKLKDVLDESPGDPRLLQLLGEVDEALYRLEEGCYGLCETCNGPIEPERLAADPLTRYCIDHLSPSEQHALEEDLERASMIQAALLPPIDLETRNWKTHYYYRGAGPVSGDYCDLLEFGDDLYFLVGDVSGKGIAASMLMAHLHATFRSLLDPDLSLEKLVSRASRMFCYSTLPNHFATLICGKADEAGTVTICNAGHYPPVLIRGAEIRELEARGLPLGMFCDEKFALCEERLAVGDTIFLYTDGVVDVMDRSGREFGKDRLLETISDNRTLPPEELVTACVEGLDAFRSGAPRPDDTTIMAVRRLQRR